MASIPGSKNTQEAISIQFGNLRRLLARIPHVRGVGAISESLTKEKTLRAGIAIAYLLQARREYLKEQLRSQDRAVALPAFAAVRPGSRLPPAQDVLVDRVCGSAITPTAPGLPGAGQTQSAPISMADVNSAPRSYFEDGFNSSSANSSGVDGDALAHTQGLNTKWL